MKMLKKSVLGAAVAIAAGFVSSGALAAGTVIDLFDNDPVQSVETATLGGFDVDQAGSFPSASVVGQYRDLYIQKVYDSCVEIPGHNPACVNSGNSVLTAGFGELALDNATGNRSLGAVTWDGSNAVSNIGDLTSTTDFGDVNTIGLAGTDLTAGGSATGFLATVLTADLGFAYEIRVWDMDGSFATLKSAALFDVQPGSPDYAFYDFEWFNFAAGSYCLGATCPPSFGFEIARSESGAVGNVAGIDFSAIGALQLILTDAGDVSVDFSVGNIATVAEPGALALVGLGLVGAAAAGRRRKMIKKA